MSTTVESEKTTVYIGTLKQFKVMQYRQQLVCGIQCVPIPTMEKWPLLGNWGFLRHCWHELCY
jgi:hypothetical protein